MFEFGKRRGEVVERSAEAAEIEDKENIDVKSVNLAAVFCLGMAAFAQDVRVEYDRSINLSACRTYQWVDYKPVQIADQLIDRDIKRAVDGQLAGKGLRRVETGGDLTVGYQASISQEKQFDSLGWGGGPPWLGNWGNTRVTTSTIEVGTLAIGLVDPFAKQLVWRGVATRTLDMSKDPDKNYRTLEKAMSKLFRNYPPGITKGK
jgi:hypothetical protein